MTVTLQNVAMILGLRIHGPPITSTCDIDWSLLCSEFLGVVPPPSQIKGSVISARWLCEQFSYPPAGVDDVILQRYACAFILALLVQCWHTYIESYVVRIWIVPQRFLDLSHYYRLHVVVPHVHDGLHDRLLPDEALTIDPLGHRWRVPLFWSHNPSPHVLTFHRDQLDAQTQDQDHRVHSTQEPSTSSWLSMRPPSLIMPVRVPPIRGRRRGGRRAGQRHVPLASTLVQPSYPPVTSTFPLFQPSASLESPLSPPDVSMPAHSSRPETTIPFTLTLIEPSILLDLPFFPHVTSIQTSSPPSPPPPPPSPQPSISLGAPPPVTEFIAPPPVTESISPLPFLEATTHAARLHVRVPIRHRAPRVRRVLPPSIPSNSTTHVDGVSQSIEIETF
ncbi:hypothetical protein AAG906_038990 [Vitis piasezkii]